jgi:hypothetical protein
MGTQRTKLEPIRYFISLIILQMVTVEKRVFLFKWKICHCNQVSSIGVRLSTSAAALSMNFPP